MSCSPLWRHTSVDVASSSLSTYCRESSSCIIHSSLCAAQQYSDTPNDFNIPFVRCRVHDWWWCVHGVFSSEVCCSGHHCTNRKMKSKWPRPTNIPCPSPDSTENLTATISPPAYHTRFVTIILTTHPACSTELLQLHPHLVATSHSIDRHETN